MFNEGSGFTPHYGLAVSQGGVYCTAPHPDTFMLTYTHTHTHTHTHTLTHTHNHTTRNTTHTCGLFALKYLRLSDLPQCISFSIQLQLREDPLQENTHTWNEI